MFEWSLGGSPKGNDLQKSLKNDQGCVNFEYWVNKKIAEEIEWKIATFYDHFSLDIIKQQAYENSGTVLCICIISKYLKVEKIQKRPLCIALVYFAKTFIIFQALFYTREN